jgi:hypothetical protein
MGKLLRSCYTKRADGLANVVARSEEFEFLRGTSLLYPSQPNHKGDDEKPKMYHPYALRCLHHKMLNLLPEPIYSPPIPLQTEEES